MKAIIAGSRTIMDAQVVAEAIHEAQVKWGRKITMGISGTAAGPDTLGAQLLKNAGVEVIYMPAKWNGRDENGRPLGRRAGIVRNKEMLAVADVVIAIWDGKSRGTAHLINEAIAQKKPIHIKRATPSFEAPPTANTNRVDVDITPQALSLTPPAL